MTGSTFRVPPALLVAVLLGLTGGCGETTTPTGPLRGSNVKVTTAIARGGNASGDASAINVGDGRLLVQNGVTSYETVRVTAKTQFAGVADFDDFVAAYRAGFRLYVKVSVAEGTERNALRVTVMTKNGPFPVHFRQTPSADLGWAGLPTLMSTGRSTVIILPWTSVRADSELATADAIVKAVTAKERVCVAGDGYTVGLLATQATMIGAWHYTGDYYGSDAACQGK